MCQSGKLNRRRDRIHPSARDPAVRRILNNHATKNHSTLSKRPSTSHLAIQMSQNPFHQLPQAAQKEVRQLPFSNHQRPFASSITLSSRVLDFAQSRLPEWVAGDVSAYRIEPFRYRGTFNIRRLITRYPQTKPVATAAFVPAHLRRYSQRKHS